MSSCLLSCAIFDILQIVHIQQLLALSGLLGLFTLTAYELSGRTCVMKMGNAFKIVKKTFESVFSNFTKSPSETVMSWTRWNYQLFHEITDFTLLLQHIRCVLSSSQLNGSGITSAVLWAQSILIAWHTVACWSMAANGNPGSANDRMRIS